MRQIAFSKPGVGTSPLLVLFLAVLAIVSKPVPAGAQAPSATSSAPAAHIQEIFSGGETFLEGPAMSPDGYLYFSDIPATNGVPGKAGIIWRLNPSTGEAHVFRSPSGMANGLKFDVNGDLLACEGADFGGRRVTKTDMKTGKSVILAGLYQGHPFNSPNDLVVAAQGRVYFTDPRYMGGESVEQPVMGVYCIEPDGEIRLVAADAERPNGIALSPDQHTLYVAQDVYPGPGVVRPLPADWTGPRPTPHGALLTYDVLPSGDLRFRSSLLTFGERRADGLAVDEAGHLYLAMGDRLEVYSPQGQLLTTLRTPATNLCFGRGRFSKTLFIAAGKSIYRVETQQSGYQIPLCATPDSH